MIMSMIIMVIIISSTTMVTIVLVFLAIFINHQLYTFIQLKIKETFLIEMKAGLCFSYCRN